MMEPDKMLEELTEKKEAPAKKPAAATAPKAAAPKEPVKKLKGLTWEVSNFIDTELTFDDYDVGPGMTFNFFNCEKLKVNINIDLKKIFFLNRPSHRRHFVV